MSLHTHLAPYIAYANCPLQHIDLAGHGQLWLRAEHDKFSPGQKALSGNKYWKLMGYLEDYLAQGGPQTNKTLLSYGGLHSNHLWALATASHLLGVPSTAIVRRAGQAAGSDTVGSLLDLGMQVCFVTPNEYRQRHGTCAPHVAERFAECYVIPEGGNGPLAEVGLQQWAMQLKQQLSASFGEGVPVYVACALGTGATFVYLAKHLPAHMHLVGLQVYKDAGLAKRITEALANCRTSSDFTILPWINKPIVDVSPFAQQLDCRVQLDPVYTAPLLWALVLNGYLQQPLPVVMLHTGGLR